MAEWTLDGKEHPRTSHRAGSVFYSDWVIGAYRETDGTTFYRVVRYWEMGEAHGYEAYNPDWNECEDIGVPGRWLPFENVKEDQ